jgi:hypothetical protein
LALEQRALNFLRKEALAADSTERLRGDITLCCDPHQLHLMAELLELLGYPFSLPASERAFAGTESNMSHKAILDVKGYRRHCGCQQAGRFGADSRLNQLWYGKPTA